VLQVAEPAAEHDQRLESAMAAANIPTLVAVLYQLTGEHRWLAAPYAPHRAKGMDDNQSGGLPEEVQGEIRAAAVAAVRAWAHGHAPAVPAPEGAELIELLGVCMGEQVPAEYEPMMAETLGIRPETCPPAHTGHDFSVIVIGAGLGGMTAAIRLREAGIAVTVLEKNSDVGGTWLENRYPGAGVDTPSYLYSLSFFPRPWTTHFGKRDEVHAYTRDLADHFDLRSMIHLDTEVISADYNSEAQRWRITTATGGQFVANAVVSAVGQLNRPKIPDLPGIDRFTGPVFHSARWPSDLDVTGKRVAVVGTGASAMQIVPATAGAAASLAIFQRSPQWIAPNDNYFHPVGDDVHWLMNHVPYYQAWYRARLAWTFNDKVYPSLLVDPDWSESPRSINAANDAHRRFFTRYLESQLAGREDLQHKALPHYPPFGKRMLLDNGWFAALRRDNVELITDTVTELTETTVRTAGGQERKVDIVVFATGFEVHRFLHPMKIRGRSGRTLRETWGPHDATAYLGITVPDYPNLFLTLGPNTALGHGGSALSIIEHQVHYIVDLVTKMIENDLGAVEPHPEVHAAYLRDVDRQHEQMVWAHPAMNNWYRNPDGRVVSALPWRIIDYRDMTLTANIDDFTTERRRTTQTGQANAARPGWACRPRA